MLLLDLLAELLVPVSRKAVSALQGQCAALFKSTQRELSDGSCCQNRDIGLRRTKLNQERCRAYQVLALTHNT